MAITILRIPTVVKRTGRSRSSTYTDIADGTCVPPVRIGPRAIGFPEHEIDALNLARVAGKSNSEIRALVSRLVADRAKVV